MPPHAGLRGKAATEGFRLFGNSRRGLIGSLEKGDSSRAIQKKNKRVKKLNHKGALDKNAINSDSDSDSDDEDDERLARARSVAVDRPPKPLRAHFPQPG